MKKFSTRTHIFRLKYLLILAIETINYKQV